MANSRSGYVWYKTTLIPSAAAPFFSILMLLRSHIYNPLPVLALSIAGAAFYAGYATLRFTGDKLSNQYFYVVPIVVPFVAFVLDRAERINRRTRAQFVIDGIVVLTAMWRVIGDVPYVSGHSLFLTFAILSTRSRVALVTASLVMLEVLYLKFLVWHDWITPTSGMVLGSVAALISWRCGMGAGVKRLESNVTS